MGFLTFIGAVVVTIIVYFLVSAAIETVTVRQLLTYR